MHAQISARQLDPFIGLPYTADFDCGHLVLLVQERIFGRAVSLPSHPRGRRGQAGVIERASATLVVQVDMPASGDVVLWRQADADGGWHYHLGTVFELGGERWVLHVPEGGYSLLERETDARLGGLQLQGYYRFSDIEATA